MKKPTCGMRTRSALARAAVGVIAVGGVVLGHALDYAIVFRDPALRRHVLAESGHGWMPGAGGFLVLVALLAMAVWVANGVRDQGAASPRLTAASLALIQSSAFLLLEMVERSAAAIPAHHAAPGLLPIGVIVQVLVALAAAALLHVAVRAARSVASLLRRKPRFARSTRSLPQRPVSAAGPRHLLGSPARAPRAPPAPARHIVAGLAPAL